MADHATPNVLDRFIGWASPFAGLRRHYGRVQLARAYEAASPRDPFKPRRAGASADADHAADAAVMRAKARSLVQNVPYIASAINALVGYTVGTGIVHRSTAPNGEQVDALFKQWATQADADGRLDYYGLQAAANRAIDVDGECLIRLRPRRPSDGLAVPLQLQLLEIDWLDSTKTGAPTPGSPNQIINGIEYDVLGAVVNYWLWPEHPGNHTTLRRNGVSASRPVPAASIIHLYDVERAGQGRGFTRLAPVISEVRDLKLYESAEIARKNLESRLGVLASGDPAMFSNEVPGASPATGSLGELAGGAITRVPDGVNLTVVQPTAMPGYTDYVKEKIHRILTAIGVTYEMGTGDLGEANFSSARVGMLNFRRGVERRQWHTLIPQMCRRVHTAVVQAAYLAGKLKTADASVEFSCPKWDYVNPEQEIAADLKEISGGMSSISEKLRRRGEDPKAVFAELASDFETLKASGVLDVMLAMQKATQPPADAAPADGQPAAGGTKPAPKT